MHWDHAAWLGRAGVRWVQARGVGRWSVCDGLAMGVGVRAVGAGVWGARVCGPAAADVRGGVRAGERGVAAAAITSSRLRWGAGAWKLGGACVRAGERGCRRAGVRAGLRASRLMWLKKHPDSLVDFVLVQFSDHFWWEPLCDRTSFATAFANI